MAARVVLHVGAPKSGTTFLQSRLHRNHRELAERGVHVPRAAEDDGPETLAFRGALDLTGARMGRGPDYATGWWPRLVEDVVPRRGTVVVSHEAFARCDAAQAGRAVRELGTGGAEVSVVFTARDLGRQLVSGWVEGVKHGNTLDLATYLARARDGELPLMAQIDLASYVDTWGGWVPPERLHVVTTPPPGADRDLLWDRFRQVCGIGADWAPHTAARVNDALGLPEVQVVLALNRELGNAARRGGRFDTLLRSFVVGRGLAGRDSVRAELDPAHFGWVAERSEAWIAAVRAAGAVVVGDLAELRPVPVDPGTWVDPDVPHPDVAPAAAAALKVVIKEAWRRRQP